MPHRSDLVPHVVLLVLVLQDVSHAQRVQEGRGVPDVGVEDALHGVAGHVRRGQRQKTWRQEEEGD